MEMKIITERVEHHVSREGDKYPYDYYLANFKVNGWKIEAIYDVPDKKMTIPLGAKFPLDEQKKLAQFVRQMFESLLYIP